MLLSMIRRIGKWSYFFSRCGGILTINRWFYKSGLTPDEVILIKCFDSKLDGRARRVPHTAFHIPGTEDKESRESIEVRALVFHEDDTLE
jgi:hypothetical protein